MRWAVDSRALENPMESALLGQSVGNHRVLTLIGQGGMGAVYLAEHVGTAGTVAAADGVTASSNRR